MEQAGIFSQLSSVKSCKNRLHVPLGRAGRPPGSTEGGEGGTGKSAHCRATRDEAPLLARSLQGVLN